MPLAPVDDKGTHLFYEDSGAPWACPHYTTLVILHGVVFHGAIFKPLIPYARQRGIRLVMVNYRDYPGSTPYSWAELAALGSKKQEAERSMLKQRGLEIAAFLRWYIMKENIPMAPSPQEYHNACGGGLAILAWSWGTAMAMSFLAQASTLPHQERWRLGSYLRTIIFYDSNCNALGVSTHHVAGFYNPILDTRIPMKNKGRAFVHWVTAHYNHRIPEVLSFPHSSLIEVRPGLVQYPSTDSSSEYENSTERMLYQEYDEVTDTGVAERSQLFWMDFDVTVYKEMTELAMYDATIWPHLQIKLVWCDRSVVETVLAAWYFAQQMRDWPEGARKVEIVRFRGANHMPHWNEPEKTMDRLAKLIHC
ncbi:Alpha/Beta hydrolase protein [Rhodofomes roseus]|uniref:Alpha/Beta hydrolase protein n=1 Tax=Rhodofomes roseus TaxID=34475 RepID=A0ABQ8KD42_9APHY|nr:Alpha/Beta hydrolase protein [Rhodofomes roseus]KAH9835554.1 Alpha/Beta hydrolase protein [Rhodofomes roseus]